MSWSEVRNKLEIAALKREIELQRAEELHEERIRFYGIQEAIEMKQREEAIERIQQQARISELELDQREEALKRIQNYRLSYAGTRAEGLQRKATKQKS